MRCLVRAPGLIVLTASFLAGCADSSMVLKGNLDQLQQQQLAVSHQNHELQARAAALDRDNQELQASLAQTRQQAKVAEDQLVVVRQQLRGVTAQLAQLREQKKSADEQTEALTASLRRRGGVTITPNNSFLETLPRVDLPDVNVRRDGDVVRIELPADRLFVSGTNQLQPEGIQYVTAAAAELTRTYPQQMIGIEGHTDSDPIQNYQWRSNHQLSIGRAMAVHDILVSQAALQANRLFIVGYGGNHPVVSNATPAGKRRNNRVELVVYPERVGQ